ncbi:MAG: glycerate kinase, partial [Propionicimonas sp.]
AELCAELADLGSTIAAADVVVTGCTAFHVGNRGGSTVRFVAALAESRQRPCLVFALESSLSRREMRTFGVEAAYSLSGSTVGQAEVTAAVVRVATGWLGAQRGNA